MGRGGRTESVLRWPCRAWYQFTWVVSDGPLQILALIRFGQSLEWADSSAFPFRWAAKLFTFSILSLTGDFIPSLLLPHLFGRGQPLLVRGGLPWLALGGGWA